MIISRSLNAIFVKTRKTAGTSVELAMSTACGPEDVITPLRDEDEQLRAQLGGRGPQHFLKSRGDDAMWNVAGMLSGGRHGQQYYNHAPAAVAIQHLGWETWESYFTFTVERDPWDKAVSRYFWEAAGRQVPDFSAFLRQCPRWSLTNFDLYAVDGEVVVDRVLRYERLGGLPRVRVTSERDSHAATACG